MRIENEGLNDRDNCVSAIAIVNNPVADTFRRSFRLTGRK